MNGMAERSRVSVVIPTYNRAPEVKVALQSVVDQTIDDWEAWVIDNHSSDNTLEVIKAFDDPRIHCARILNEGIIARSRNKGIRKSRGKYIAFLDSDDVWLPNKLERVLGVFRHHPEVDLVCHWEGVRRSGAIVGAYRYGPEARATYRRLLFGNNQCSTSAVTIRRDVLVRLSGFDEAPSFVTVEDYDLWLRIARAGFRIRFLPEVLGEFRITGQNMSSRIELHYAALREVIMRHYERLQPRRVIDPVLLRWRLVRIRYSMQRALFLSGRETAGTRHTRLASVKHVVSGSVRD